MAPVDFQKVQDWLMAVIRKSLLQCTHVECRPVSSLKQLPNTCSIASAEENFFILSSTLAHVVSPYNIKCVSICVILSCYKETSRLGEGQQGQVYTCGSENEWCFDVSSNKKPKSCHSSSNLMSHTKCIMTYKPDAGLKGFTIIL